MFKKIRLTQIIETEIDLDEDLNQGEQQYMVDMLYRDYSDHTARRAELEDQGLRVQQQVAGIDVRIV
jgi:hypothetical protein